MKHSLRSKLAVGAMSVISLTGFITGMALAAPTCADERVGTCSLTGTQDWFTCCVDEDGDGISHTASCLRNQFLCYTVSGTTTTWNYRWGAAFNCGNYGSQCS